MVGKLPSAAAAARTGIGFAREGDAIALVGPHQPSLAGSELAKLRGQPLAGPLPGADPGAIRAAHELVREAVRTGRVRSAHDVSEGGLAAALAECCLAGGLGARVSVAGVSVAAAASGVVELFGEAPGQAFIVSGAEEELAGIGVVIGRVGGAHLEIADQLSVPVSALRDARERGLAQWV
jgi:phosphoribosylformylglycinamidine synthase